MTARQQCSAVVTSCGYVLHATGLFTIGSRPSDHYFRSVLVYLAVCLCRVFLSRLWSDFDQTTTCYMSASSCVP